MSTVSKCSLVMENDINLRLWEGGGGCKRSPGNIVKKRKWDCQNGSREDGNAPEAQEKRDTEGRYLTPAPTAR